MIKKYMRLDFAYIVVIFYFWMKLGQNENNKTYEKSHFLAIKVFIRSFHQSTAHSLCVIVVVDDNNDRVVHILSSRNV